MDFFSSTVALVAIVTGVGAPVLLIGLVLWYKARRLRMVHETALALAEKGQPVSVKLLALDGSQSSDLRTGLVLVGVGTALALFMWQLSAPWSLGLIPMFAGFGYLIAWKIEGAKPDDHKDSQ